jgi:maleate isomerase
MTKITRLGILVPSSNTSLEPLTQAIIAQLPNVTVHFSRFAVVKISLEEDALSQFQTEKIIEAAKLLADAQVDIIGWSGTSSGWLGFQTDEKLCAAITAATGGIPATTSVLALNKAMMGTFSLREIGLVTPYLDNVQKAIIDNYAAIGIDCSKEAHLGLSKNTDFGAVDEATLDRMVANVAAKQVRAITIFCTNLRAAQRVVYWEQRYGIVVLDTVVTVLWDMLRYCKVDTAGLTGWGELLRRG